MVLLHKKNILFITPYPEKIAPSQRFRFEQYFEILRKDNYNFTLKPFISASVYEHGRWHHRSTARKATSTFLGFCKRVLLLFSLGKFDFIFIHREVLPVGPPIFEWLIVKVFRKKIIYDFDDAIWLTDRDERFFERILRCRSKVGAICKWSYKVSCGNQYLAEYALGFNKNVIVNPSTIDTALHNPDLFPHSNGENVVVGWTGSRTTLKYLEEVEQVLMRLEKKFPFLSFLVIADRPAKLSLKNLQFKQWTLETEVSDLATIDIGIMPLPDDEWTKGKCGFKALQYMALEKCAVVSPVGVNIEIIENGVQGYWGTTENEWFTAIEKLVENSNERSRMGKLGREKVIQHYSVLSNSSNFLSLFQ